MSDDIVVDILRRFLGEPSYWKRSSHQISFDCPECSKEKGLFNGDGKGNLEVNYEKDVYKCWACYERNGTSGKLRKLIKKYGSPSDLNDFDLAKPDLTYELNEEEENKEQKEIIRYLPDEFVSLSNSDYDSPLKRKALYYLTELRGISYDLIRKYNIGFAEEGRYNNRIVIPSYDREGRINYFSTRSFGGVKPKYLNPPQADKTNIIFNDHLLKYDFTIYLVEGVFDHIVVPNSTPLLGLEINEEFIYKLHEKANSYVVILLDGEAYEEAISIYHKLNVGNLENRVKICYPPRSNLDPSKVYEEEGPNGIINMLKGSFKK